MNSDLSNDMIILAAAVGDTAPKVEVGVSIPGGPRDNFYNYNTYIKAFYKFSIDLGTSLAVLMIIYASYKYVTSQGNQTAVNDAKEIILGALLGFALLLLIRFILGFLGLPDPGIKP